MKTKIYLFTAFLIITVNLTLLAQGGMTIKSGGAVTVQGNLTLSDCPPPEVPTLGQIPSDNQIVWNWNVVNGATGYKWNTINDFNSAIPIGILPTKIETGLTCNTTYTRYVWAYNGCGNSNPVVLTQTTSLNSPSPPTSGTHVPSPYQIIWNWNTVAGAMGYKWNTTNDYNTATDLGLLTSKIETGLYCITSYTRYIWAYSSCGISNVTTLNQTTSVCDPNACGQPITDTRDGKTYNTVLIGNQCWFAQNLNVGKRISSSNWQSNNSIIEKYCYNDNENNCNTYGGMYQWFEVMQYTINPGSQGICPGGWHLPSDAEWTILTTFLGGESIAGGKMKEKGTIHWYSPNTNATNSSGFNALPGGKKDTNTAFDNLYANAYLWTSSQIDASSSLLRHLGYYSGVVDTWTGLISDSFSVRCIKDN